MEHYIYNVPVFITHEPASSIDISAFCSDCQEILPSALLKNIDVVYIGNFKELHDKNAAYLNGGIYMSAAEPTVFDMVENFVHEVAHSLEDQFAWQIYDDEDQPTLSCTTAQQGKFDQTHSPDVNFLRCSGDIRRPRRGRKGIRK